MSTLRRFCVAVVVAIVTTAVTIVASEPGTAGKKFRPRERGGIERHCIVALNRTIAGPLGRSSAAPALAEQLVTRYGVGSTRSTRTPSMASRLRCRKPKQNE
jgi:hypothetical protein